jgi:hypothetical protein
MSNPPESTAIFYLEQDVLPEFDNWRRSLEKTAKDADHIGGIGMALGGSWTKRQQQPASSLSWLVI